jgi:MFS family permease
MYLEGLVFLLLTYTEDNEEVAVIETSYFIGIAIGAVILSWVSNNYGRKLTLVIC